MKYIQPILLLIAAAIFADFGYTKYKASHPDEKPIVGSIKVDKKDAEAASLVKLVKISFSDAAKSAESAVSGSAVKGKLKVEDGFLIYSFKLVLADKSMREVSIDAGDAKVLEIEIED